MSRFSSAISLFIALILPIFPYICSRDYSGSIDERSTPYTNTIEPYCSFYLQKAFDNDMVGSSGSYHSGPNLNIAVGNIDNDPSLEILATALAAGPLYAWNSDGSLVSGYPLTDYYGAAYPALGNFAGDNNKLEISVGYIDNKVNVYGASGHPLPGWPITTPNYVSRAPIVADVNGDGFDEIFIGPEDGKIHAFEHDGSNYSNWPKAGLEFQNMYPIAIADLDGDGDLEIIATSGWVEPYIYAFHHYGKPVNGFPIHFSSNFQDHYAAVGDVDNDGAPEIIIPVKLPEGGFPTSVHVISNDGIIERTMKASRSAFYGTAPVLADLDGNGIPEIIVQTNGAIDVWYGDGTVYSGWPVILGDSEKNWLRDTTPVVGDLDGDHQPEIVVINTISGGISTEGEIRVYSNNGVFLCSYDSPMFTTSTPAIADIDLDGRSEVVVRFDRRILVYDFGGPASGDIEWGQYGAGPQHKGYYPPSPASKQDVDLYLNLQTVDGTPPNSIVPITIQYGNNGAALANNIILTATLDAHLSYVSDSTHLPITRENNVISWNTASPLAYAYKKSFTLLLRTGSDVNYGDSYPLLLEITSDGPETAPSDNTKTISILISSRVFLPLVSQMP